MVSSNNCSTHLWFHCGSELNLWDTEKYEPKKRAITLIQKMINKLDRKKKAKCPKIVFSLYTYYFFVETGLITHS